jgi:hypothetical protein
MQHRHGARGPRISTGAAKKEIPRVTLLIGDGKKLAHRGHMFRPAGI